MNRLILLVESRIRGDVYVRFGGELPKTHRSNTAGRWMLSLPLKSVHDLVKGARKVQQTILLVGDISDIYVTNFNTMTGDPNFTVEELSAIAFGYNRLLKESSDLLLDLKEVTTATGLSMTDKERLDIINRIYGEVLRVVPAEQGKGGCRTGALPVRDTRAALLVIIHPLNQEDYVIIINRLDKPSRASALAV
mgnify:CR=1 FL=1